MIEWSMRMPVWFLRVRGAKKKIGRWARWLRVVANKE